MSGKFRLLKELNNEKGSSLVEILVAFTILMLCLGMLHQATMMSFNLQSKAKENNEITQAKYDILYMLKPILVYGSKKEDSEGAETSTVITAAQYNTQYKASYGVTSDAPVRAGGEAVKNESVHFYLRNANSKIALKNSKELVYNINIDAETYKIFAIDCDNITMPFGYDPNGTGTPNGNSGGGGEAGISVPGIDNLVINKNSELKTNESGIFNYSSSGGTFYYKSDDSDDYSFYAISKNTEFSAWDLLQNPDTLDEWYRITKLRFRDDGKYPEVTKMSVWGDNRSESFSEGDIVYRPLYYEYYKANSTVEGKTYWDVSGLKNDLINTYYFEPLPENYTLQPGETAFEVPEPLIIVYRGDIIHYEGKGYYYLSGGSRATGNNNGGVSAWYNTISDVDAAIGNGDLKLVEGLSDAGSGSGGGSGSGAVDENGNPITIVIPEDPYEDNN